MAKISRRDFLKVISVSLGLTALESFLAACNEKTTPPATADLNQPTVLSKASDPLTARPTQGITPPGASNTPQNSTSTLGETKTQASQSTAVEPATPTRAPVASTGLPDLVVAHGTQPAELVNKTLVALGGIERFVKPGMKVIVKPNICVAYHTYEYAATTNPWVVGAIVKACVAAGAASVRVMDYPFGGTAQEAYSKSGIQEQVIAAGGEMVVMTGLKYVSTDIPNGKKLTQTKIYDEVLKADALINVPIAKHHGSARLTLGMKNLMGLVQNRAAMHQSLGQSIADLTSRIMPALTIIDATRILLRNGPSGGNLDDVKQLDTLVASADIVAADSYATRFFNQQPLDIPFIQAGMELGLGRTDVENLKIEEFFSGS